MQEFRHNCFWMFFTFDFVELKIQTKADQIYYNHKYQPVAFLNSIDLLIE